MKSIFSIFLLSLLSASCHRQSISEPYTQKVQVGTQTLYVQVVSTPEEMAQGLSGRQKLSDEQGMLFEFNQTFVPSFWMKDMNFALDLIWIANNKVVGVEKNVKPPAPNTQEDQLPLYRSPQPVDTVLEVNAGWSEKNNLKIGDEIKKLP